MDKHVFHCQACGEELQPTSEALQSHLREKHPGGTIARTEGRLGWLPPLPPGGLENAISELESAALANTPDEHHGDILATADIIRAEVRRLRAELASAKLATSTGTVNLWLDPHMPEGVAAMVSGDQVTYIRNMQSEDMRAARKAERQRCVDHLLRAGSPGDSVMSDTLGARRGRRAAGPPLRLRKQRPPPWHHSCLETRATRRGRRP
jgi:hypothetical protein